MQTAFVLGAGLGTRLKSLTAQIPKPLIPVLQKPLITYAFDHLIRSGFQNFIVNTHHRAEAFDAAFPDRQYRGRPITFRHEPELLETGGGIANIADLVGGNSFLVYNGDILTDIPIPPALERHQDSGNLATLLLRRSGRQLHIACDESSGKIVDIRNLLGTGIPCEFLFTGIYLVDPGLFSYLTPGKKESIVPAFLQVIRNENALGGVVVEEGSWWDLGDRDAYLEANAALIDGDTPFPSYGMTANQRRIHPAAQIDPAAVICPLTSVGENAVVEARARVEDSVIWPGARVAAGSRLRRCIVRHNALVSGDWTDADL